MMHFSLHRPPDFPECEIYFLERHQVHVRFGALSNRTIQQG
jgi:hypothetical protein